MDEDRREVRRGAAQITLTGTEFEVLRHLMQHHHCVLSSMRIGELLWGDTYGGHVEVVDRYVSYLRRNVDAGRDPMIHTVGETGYMLRAASEQLEIS